MREPAGLARRVRAWLEELGRPVSSARVVEQFLRMASLPEDRATRLLAPSLEGSGLGYEPGVGWGPEAASPEARAGQPVVAVFDPEARAFALAAADGRGGAQKLDPSGSEATGMTYVVPERADAAPLRAWLRACGHPPPGAIVTWRAALRGRVRLPRGAGVETVAAALGVRWHDADDAPSRARVMATCLDLAGGAAAGRVVPEPGKTAPAAGPACRVPRDQIEALPAAPGTYRFYAEDGTLLYVGKARDLRRRVTSYFRPGRRGGHGARFLSRAVRLEHQAEGSELEALLREARVLARRSPPGNVQIEVHERGRRYAAARVWALLLPRAGEDGVTAVLVREGRYLGHLILGPRGGGLPAARRLLARALRAHTGQARGARRGAGAADRDTEILMSWLARNEHDVSRVEMDSFRTAQEALRALRDAARTLRLHADRVIVRGAPRGK